MAGYLIEYRFHGYAKTYSRNLMYDVAKKFRTRGVIGRGRAVPHMTLYGPFSTKNERRMTSEIVQACRDYSLVPFRVEGFGHFGKEVIYMRIRPSKELEDLRRDISERLLKLTNTRSEFDSKFNLSFHATIAFRDIERKFGKIWSYIDQKPGLNIKQHLLRVTVLRGHRILYEYDLLQQRLLMRREALSKRSWGKTLELLKQKTTNYEQDVEEYEIASENIAKRLRWQLNVIKLRISKYLKRAHLWIS
ncbi:MAG: 2'-5' RNA ligase family protein [Chloroflexi bacterium]|nr:2'-5' RNA ligase family protein [Chloroflexota bacterium]